MAFTVSELQAKKAQVLSYIEDGMDIERAFILTQTSTEMQETLAADESFMLLVDSAQATLEHTLVKRLLRIAEENEARGISTEIRFLLPKLNPDRWGSGKNSNPEDAGASGIDPEDRGI